VYTRCPECKTAYRINVSLLRAGRGRVFCKRCHTIFNALQALAGTVKDSVAAGPPRVPILEDRHAVVMPNLERQRLDEVDHVKMPEIRAGDGAFAADVRRRKGRPPVSTEHAWRWGAGVVALVILLGVQVFKFEGRHLAQNVHARPWLDGLCSRLGCVLPPFKETARIQIMDRALKRAGGKKEGFEFSLIFANQSDLPQAFPALKLVLHGLDSRPVAERIFEPPEYLPEWRDGALMQVGRPFEVHLSIARPSREVGGFVIAFK
jgi:predicted Zn finger-like uncharacterized protein